MKRVFTWLNNSLEEFLMGAGLIMMTAIMGIQVVFRYAFGMSLSWSEEITRYILESTNSIFVSWHLWATTLAEIQFSHRSCLFQTA